MHNAIVGVARGGKHVEPGEARGTARGAAYGEGVDVQDVPIREVYAFSCRTCGQAWQREYEIRRVHDSRGLIQSAFFLDGLRATSPLTQSPCDGCGSARVLVTPRTRRARPDRRRDDGDVSVIARNGRSR